MEVKVNSFQKLSTFALIMIAIVSVDSLRNLPIAAQYGFALVTFYIIGALFFFLPLTYVASNLAVQYPKTGGSYIWVSTAFGSASGNLAIWLQWIYNIIWCPTIFVFISVTLASMISTKLETNHTFILIISLVFFWGLSLLHCFGVKVTSWISSVSAMVGTLIPMGIIIALAFYWLYSGNPSASELSLHALIPTSHDFRNIGFFSNILFSLLGQEVIAMHAGNVNNPEKSYPIAFAISAFVILITIICSSLALCVIMPAEKIALASGLIDVLEEFFRNYNLLNLSVVIGICIIIGGLGIASSWMIGLARGLQVSFTTMRVPHWLKSLNTNHMPVGVLFLQSVIYTILLSAFLFFENINSSYWILSAITAQFALLYYILLFGASIKLLFNRTKSKLSQILAIAMPVLGILTCIIGILVGFVPPDFVPADERTKYELTMLAVFFGIALLVTFQFFRKRTK